MAELVLEELAPVVLVLLVQLVVVLKPMAPPLFF
jgi:hypothetical protein